MTEVQNKQYGYHGNTEFEFPADRLQLSSTNEVDPNFRVEVKASLKSDGQVINQEVMQSYGPALYKLDNPYDADCDLKNVNQTYLSQPGIYLSGIGKGWTGHDGCVVDKDSEARFSELTDKRYIRQLPQLHNNGFFGKGPHDVDTESIIQSSNFTSVQRPCGTFIWFLYITLFNYTHDTSTSRGSSRPETHYSRRFNELMDSWWITFPTNGP